MLISKVFHCPVADIIPYTQNAKLHPDTQIKQIINSITEFGFNDPIAVDEDMIVLEGHGRLLAAKQLKLEFVPVIKITDLSEPQKIAYRLAHNKINANSGFNPELLEVEFGLLESYNFDTSLTGFSALDINISDAFNDTEQLESELEQIPDLLPETQEGFKRKCPECGHEWTEPRKPKKKY